MKPDQKQKYSIEFFRDDYCTGCEEEARSKPMKPTVYTLLANALTCTFQKIKSVMTTKYKK